MANLNQLLTTVAPELKAINEKVSAFQANISNPDHTASAYEIGKGLIVYAVDPQRGILDKFKEFNAGLSPELRAACDGKLQSVPNPAVTPVEPPPGPGAPTADTGPKTPG